MRILLIEPDRVVAGQMTSYFKLSGHIVTAHADPQAAIISIDKSKPDIIITELVLAGRSGSEFLYELRSYPDWLKIPVIIYTGLPTEKVKLYKQELDQLNILAYLSKSLVSLEQLTGYFSATQVKTNAKV